MANSTCPVCGKAVDVLGSRTDTQGNRIHFACEPVQAPVIQEEPPRPTTPAAVPPDIRPAPAPLPYATPRPRSGNIPNRLISICVARSEMPVFATMDAGANAIGTLHVGDLFSIGQLLNQNGVKRVSGTLLDGTPVFIPADGKVFRIRAAKLQRGSEMFAEPSKSSASLGKLKSGEQIVLVDQATRDGVLFSEIRDQYGRTGYIDGKVKVLPISARRNTASKDMLIGGIVCVVGIGITIGTYSAAASSPRGGTYFIAWGPAIFGAIQFFKGVARLGESSPPASILERMIQQIVDEKTSTRVR